MTQQGLTVGPEVATHLLCGWWDSRSLPTPPPWASGGHGWTRRQRCGQRCLQGPDPPRPSPGIPLEVSTAVGASGQQSGRDADAVHLVRRGEGFCHLSTIQQAVAAGAGSGNSG